MPAEKFLRVRLDVKFKSDPDMLHHDLTQLQDVLLLDPESDVLGIACDGKAVRLTQSQAESDDWPQLGVEVVAS